MPMPRWYLEKKEIGFDTGFIFSAIFEIDADLGEPTSPIHRGLAGEDIPLFARIVGLADVYDALSSRRSYKDPWPESKVLDEVRRESGRHFDPELVELLLERVEEFRSVRRRFGD